MTRLVQTAAIAALCILIAPLASQGADISVERGRQISVIGGCNDCHTVGYNESGGQIDPAKALKGSAIGWRGPWGTTYAANLRLIARQKAKSEDEFVQYAKTLKTRPPMPWYNVRAMDESDLRSLYQYIMSLGDPGDPPPDAVPPDQEPKTPYRPIEPPVAPKS